MLHLTSQFFYGGAMEAETNFDATPDVAVFHGSSKTAESSVKDFDATPDVAVLYGGAKNSKIF